MELIEHTFEELSAFKCRIYTTLLPGISEKEVLIVAFEGEYSDSGKGSDSTYIDVMLAAAEAAWQTSFLVLDYRLMSYQWGDRLPLEWGPERLTAEEEKIVRLFGSIPKHTAVLVSDLCRESIESLINAEEIYSARAGSGISWLFDNLDAALAAFDRVLLQ